MPFAPRAALNVTFAASFAALLLASCQSKPPEPVAVSHTALSKMERVMKGANVCWFKSGDPAFKSYQLAPELNSFSGRPRILVVERKNPGGRPLLVVQAEGDPAKMEAFGPLMTDHASRITKDVNRWAAGTDQGC